MGNIFLCFLVFSSIQLSATTQGIERAFLQNNPKMLYGLFPSHEHINISMPDPISFSDQLSSQQSYFLFKKIFSSYSTFEFYPDRRSPLEEEIRSIFKARWSFRDKKNGNQFVFHVFFYLIKKTDQGRDWVLTEIKAEKF